MTEREEFVARLRECHATTHTRALIDAAADMLEADAQPATSDEWLANCPQSVRDLANRIKAEMSVPQEPVAYLAWRDGKP